MFKDFFSIFNLMFVGKITFDKKGGDSSFLFCYTLINYDFF